MTTYEITYSFKTANGFDITSKYKGLTKDEAEKICKNIEALDGYKLIDISAEI